MLQTWMGPPIGTKSVSSTVPPVTLRQVNLALVLFGTLCATALATLALELLWKGREKCLQVLKNAVRKC